MSFHCLNDSWIITRGYQLITCRFNLVTHGFQLITRQVKIKDLNSHFWISTCAFKLSTHNWQLVTHKVLTRNSCFSILRAGMFSKITVVLRTSHSDAYFNRAVLNLRLSSLKDFYAGVQFLGKIHVTCCRLPTLLQMNTIPCCFSKLLTTSVQ